MSQSWYRSPSSRALIANHTRKRRQTKCCILVPGLRWFRKGCKKSNLSTSASAVLIGTFPLHIASRHSESNLLAAALNRAPASLLKCALRSLLLLLNFSCAGTNLEQDPDGVFLKIPLLLVERAATDVQSAFVDAITAVFPMLAVALLPAVAALLTVGLAWLLLPFQVSPELLYRLLMQVSFLQLQLP